MAPSSPHLLQHSPHNAQLLTQLIHRLTPLQAVQVQTWCVSAGCARREEAVCAGASVVECANECVMYMQIIIIITAADCRACTPNGHSA